MIELSITSKILQFMKKYLLEFHLTNNVTSDQFNLIKLHKQPIIQLMIRNPKLIPVYFTFMNDKLLKIFNQQESQKSKLIQAFHAQVVEILAECFQT